LNRSGATGLKQMTTKSGMTGRNGQMMPSMNSLLLDEGNYSGDAGHPIPDIVIRRLPIYLRTLTSLLEKDVTSINSEELAESIGVTAAQIRRDLSYFGKFGKQGKGYDVRFLTDEIHHILQLDRPWNCALVGYGNLGQAIVHYGGFVPTSFNISAIFDRNETIGQLVNGLIVKEVDDITDTVAELGIKIGIIAVPPSSVQAIADKLIAGGVTAILNYAPIVIKAPPHVMVREVDPIGAMQSMTYYLDDQG
jgi:redox-sensing transcriptional repressor